MAVISVKRSKYYFGAAVLSLMLIMLIYLIICSARVSVGSDSAKAHRNIIEIYRDFLLSFGWETDETPVEISEILIPSEFNEVYKQYNDIQLSQGFDLEAYRGKTVKKYVFSVCNYPGIQNDGSVRATLLTFNGNIIGGDVCSVRMDGFMHGFLIENG